MADVKGMVLSTKETNLTVKCTLPMKETHPGKGMVLSTEETNLIVNVHYQETNPRGFGL